jgi:hypothetical protein
MGEPGETPAFCASHRRESGESAADSRRVLHQGKNIWETLGGGLNGRENYI